MEKNRITYGWLIGLWVLLWLTAGPDISARPLPNTATGLVAEWLDDTDNDGVSDANDLCPGTPLGTAVNTYGCPIDLAQCDYTTSTVTLKSSGGSSGSTVTTSYVLADNTGRILQISNTPGYTGLTGSATYMALAITYDGPVTNLSVGSSLSTVSASCLAWSNALVFKACVAVPPPSACDYQVGQSISLQTAGGSSGAGIKTSYVLTDASGKLVSISTTPSFLTTGLTAGTYQAYALTYTDDNSIANLVVNGSNTLGQVTASCLAVSPAYPIKLCSPCPTRCVPILVVKIR